MLTEKIKNIIEGCLLGDGSLIISKNGKNPYFSYRSKNKDHVEYVFDFFRDFCNYNEVKVGSYLDERTNKVYTSYYFITKCAEDFLPIYNKWYGEGEKNVIPEDLVLDNIKCLLWYLGDGGISRSSRTEYIKFATNCFDFDSLQKTIIPQLAEYDAKIYLSDNQPIILLPRRRCKDFLYFIGSCPVESYQYKWNLTEYKNKKYENKIDKLSPETIKKICELYIGGMSYKKISEEFNLEHNRVKYYLVKEGIYVNGRDKLKKKLSNEDILKVKKMRDDSIPWRDIESLFNIDRYTLSYYIKSVDKRK